MGFLIRIIVIVGVLVAVFGVIFAAQGQGIIGPPQSIMVNNPAWITYGSIIAGVGIILAIVGVLIPRRR